MSHLETRKPRPKFVIGVEIDDRAFFEKMGLPAGYATDRRKLGQIIQTVATFHPAVIALDIDLSSEPADSKEPRKSENEVLLGSIQGAIENRIAVVLTYGFDQSGRGLRMPNIFEDAMLPGFGDSKNPFRVRTGFDNSAADKRKVPLVVDRVSANGILQPHSSFALEAVGAYEDVLQIRSKTLDRLHTPISNRKFVYTSFFSQEEFPRISAADVLQPNESLLQGLNHRIVLIGGNRHAFPGSPTWLDDFSMPPLEMRGMYLQANYMEGLLDDRIRSTVPRWMAFVIDLVLGALIIHLSSGTPRFALRLIRLAMLFVPVALAYIAFANLGYVLDFVLPLLLLCVHGPVDHYLQYRFRTQ